MEELRFWWWGISRCDTMKSQKIFDIYAGREVSWSSHNIMSHNSLLLPHREVPSSFLCDSGGSVTGVGCGRWWYLQGLFQLFSCNLLKFLKMSIFQVRSTLPLASWRPFCCLLFGKDRYYVLKQLVYERVPNSPIWAPLLGRMWTRKSPLGWEKKVDVLMLQFNPIGLNRMGSFKWIILLMWVESIWRQSILN